MGVCMTKLQKEKSKSKTDATFELPTLPRELLITRSLPRLLSVVEQRNEFVQLDQVLGRYYHQFGRSDYFNKAGNGLFLQYLLDNNLTDISLLESDDEECSIDLIYTRFDPKFPINNDTLVYINKNKISKERVILFVIQYCYKFKAHPPPNRYVQYMVLDTSRHSLNHHKGDHRRNTVSGGAVSPKYMVIKS
eukprot:138797_1